MWKNGVFSNINPPDSNGFASPTKVSNSGVVVGTFEIPGMGIFMDLPLKMEPIPTLMCRVLRIHSSLL